jgi:hypothetical protein|tara:strand:+ start:2168 stop:2395 length:228 start_codon:yes stop_codon:yes gene_type:complete
MTKIWRKEEWEQFDKINPPYYKKQIQVTDFILSYNMDWLEGNVIKYVTRYKDKNGVEDLKKAEWYLQRLIKEKSE